MQALADEQEVHMAYADRVATIPETNPNRPRRKLTGGMPSYITIHETGNTNKGANAEMHRKFVLNGGGTEGVSFHYVVDDHESIQLLPDDEVAWHAGDGPHGPGNSTSLAIETCVNSDDNFEHTKRNLVKLTVKLMAAYGIPATKVVQHNYWSGKDCPHFLRRSGWDQLISQLTVALAKGREFPTGFTLSGPFRTYFEQHGDIPVFGVPISGVEVMAFPGIGTLQVQWFERSRLEIQPDGTITRGLVGAEALAAHRESTKRGT